MALPKKYSSEISEPRIQAFWRENEIHRFDIDSPAPIFSIDTPPATISGSLHLGHLYSYCHPDFFARFWRMKGHNVFYPMGFDNNGLPTEHLVEKEMGKRVDSMDRDQFQDVCQRICDQYESEYRNLWNRIGLSVDWNYSYRTIDYESRKLAQLSFIDLWEKELIYRKNSPTIWCPECRTAIAQAELNDIDCPQEFVTIKFKINSSSINKPLSIKFLPIATTRPELLPACVAIFVNPKDSRYIKAVSEFAEIPLFNRNVPILTDLNVDPTKGTGVVMCCTFGDQMDIHWWHTYKLPLIDSINKQGNLTETGGKFASLSVPKAREEITKVLIEKEYLLNQETINHSIHVHERCDTPIEYISTPQWFIRIMDQKEEILGFGDKVVWHPHHMKSRYKSWVENLNWDWCISRQRSYGVQFPVWFCSQCESVIIADNQQLPVDPHLENPQTNCHNCGNDKFRPETDVMDTWATSSLTPQIAGRWISDLQLYQKVFPFSLRPQAHEIIRTWAFYTIVKSNYHHNSIPWKNALISGWGLSGKGLLKISKSRGGGALNPSRMIEKYSADAIRYWAASTGPGKDTIVSEEKIQIGAKLITKIWNIARFSVNFIQEYSQNPATDKPPTTPADNWILSSLHSLIKNVTNYYENYDYAVAKAETEIYFWTFSNNYIEMVKQRLYNKDSHFRNGALYTLHECVLNQLKLFAPILPHITEMIFQNVFNANNLDNPEIMGKSIHKTTWPDTDLSVINKDNEFFGDMLIRIASQVRRFKSEHNLPLNSSLMGLEIYTEDTSIALDLKKAEADLASVTRIEHINIVSSIGEEQDWIIIENGVMVKIIQ